MLEKHQLLARRMIDTVVASGVQVIGSELSGSLFTGIAPVLPGRDLDLIVYVDAGTEITPDLTENVASAVSGAVTAFKQVNRFGCEIPLAHIHST